MKYQENVCQYKNFSSISIVSGSNISQTSSLPLSKKESNGTTVEHQDVQLGKGLKEILKPSVLSGISASPSRISRVSKHSLQCLRQEFLSSSCRGEKEWKYKLDSICSAWSCVLNVCAFFTLTTMKGHCGADQSLAMWRQWWGGRAEEPEVERTRMGGWRPIPQCSGAAHSMAVSLHPRLRAGWMRRGDKRYENIILANYSPASLVLSKILWSKSIREAHH